MTNLLLTPRAFLVGLIALGIAAASGDAQSNIKRDIAYPVVIGTEPVPLPSTGHLVSGVELQAICNTGQAIWLNTTSAVGVGNGWRLLDGDTKLEEISDANQLWAVADGAGAVLIVWPARR